MLIKIHGKIHYLRCVIDREGNVLDILVTSCHDAKVTTRSFASS
ncbi:MAG TPA: hypothetical protein VHH52_07125 [Pseudonocardiaceae bacterium]|nr:hypothetical protein [Pseudonocardiaceae bacterium]